MPMGRGLSGSEVAYITALSPTAIGAAGSSDPFDLSNFTWGTVKVTCDSANLVVNVARSATSNGTFAQIGASLQSVASKTVVRSFTMDSSAVWYLVSYDNGNAGSITPDITLIAQGARRTPIEQDSNTSVISSVL